MLVLVYCQEMFEDVRGIISSSKSKKDRQINCQKKNDKRTNKDQ